MDKQEHAQTMYWRRNLRLVGGLLTIWFSVSFGAGIIFVEPLNTLRLAGFPMGFWFAHQGAIVVFILLIAAYCIRMDRLDKQYSEPPSSPEHESTH